MMEISVIIPSFKPEKYLWECLISLKAQTLDKSKFEIILLLNGCFDPYYSDIQRFASIELPDYNFILLQTDLCGVSNARNIGLDRAQGEYICFIDDDDIISPNYLESLLAVSSPECVGCSNSYDFTNDVNVVSYNFVSQKFRKCIGINYSQYTYRGHLSPPWAKMIHKDIIGKVRFNTMLAYSEDSVFCMEISPRIKKMQLTNDDCIYYLRRRAGSVTKKPFSFRRQISQMAIMMLCYSKAFLSHPLSYDLRFVLSRYIAAIRNTWKYYLNCRK